MPGHRQQRAPRNRRVISTTQPQAVPQLAMIVDGVAGTALLLRARVYSQPPGSAGDPLAMQLSGIPAIFRPADSTMPVSASLSDNETLLHLIYGGSGIVPTESFSIGPYDPAIRTASGGFMAPGILAQATTPPLQNTFTAVAQLDGSVIVTIAGGDFGEVVIAPQHWAGGPGGAGVTSFHYEAGVFPIVFTAPISAGDTIIYNGPALGGGGAAKDIIRTAVVCT